MSDATRRTGVVRTTEGVWEARGKDNIMAIEVASFVVLSGVNVRVQVETNIRHYKQRVDAEPA